MQSNFHEKNTSKDFEVNEPKIQKQIKPTFNISSNLRRPNSLDLSMDSRSSNKSINNGKKSLTYDLWVNENITKSNENANSKKIDLAGRVSFR